MRTNFERMSPRLRRAAEFAIEREMLRIAPDGTLAQTSHPETLGHKATHPYITTDFAESQVELITPVFRSTNEASAFLETLYDIVANDLESEYLWPQSMPCALPENGHIALADFGEENREASQYREYLLSMYGAKKQLISGIHFNFSFPEKWLRTLHSGSPLQFAHFKNALYLKLTRQYLRHRWLVVYLLGNTPAVHTSYDETCVSRMAELTIDACTNHQAVSYRNSDCGYTNNEALYPNYSSLEAYVDSVRRFLTDGRIRHVNELYSPIRIKSSRGGNRLDRLSSEGIDYIEIRNIDINPFEKAGIATSDLEFLHLLLLYLALSEETDERLSQQEAFDNQLRVAKFGRNPELTLSRNGETLSMRAWAEELFDSLERFNDTFALGFNDTLTRTRNRLPVEHSYAARSISAIATEGFTTWSLRLARQYKEDAHRSRFRLPGYEDMELSTQILMKAAIKRGAKVDVIDRADQFIRIRHDGRTEYVKQATKTSKDNYVSVLMMENKTVTKHILREQGIVVPDGVELHSETDLAEALEAFAGQALVLKPKSTNFGLGISIFTKAPTYDDALQAFRFAKRHDETVLLETFLPGKEYRFLVIGDEVAGILHRVPANVVGDGNSSIKELVTVKNTDSLRGKGYKTPLEKIELNEVVDQFLKQQGKTVDNVLEIGEIVYLRENSNISTGGDSIDFTDRIPEAYKNIAVEAARAVDATICGVDMMIPDIDSDEVRYGIIELNFNPAIHIHCFPFEGTERPVGDVVFNLLFPERDASHVK